MKIGNCSTSWIAKHFFKSCVKYEISNLLYKVIDGNQPVTMDDKRLTKLLIQMNTVREISNEWNNMINMPVNHMPCMTIKNILELLPECKESLRIGNILCLCTYVTDVCKLLRNEHPDVCKIIDIMDEYMLEKHFEMCLNFICYLYDI